MLHRASTASKVSLAVWAWLWLALVTGCHSPSPPSGTDQASAATFQAADSPPAPAFQPAVEPSGESWNEAQIAWHPYEDGLSIASHEHKPVCLVFFTSWCGHCKNYSKLFNDARVVEAAKGFVMVKLDRDEHKDVSAKFAPDGDYIPRTHFLASNGTLDADIHAQRPSFKYFYDESRADSLLAGMSEARIKLN